MIPRKPHHKGFKPPSKPMNRQGKGARRNAKQNRENKARFVKEGIECCQMCGSTEGLSNSHSRSSDRRLDEARTALLCIWPCHQFLELECTHEEREAVNEFLIETSLEGLDKAEAAFKLIPTEKAAAWRAKLFAI